MNEPDLMRTIQLEASRQGARLFRNNVAQAWIGDYRFIHKQETVRLIPGDVLIHHARVLHSGLCVGSSDLIGIKNGKFLAIEVKEGNGKPTVEQASFVQMVNDNGGRGGIVWSVEDSLKLMEGL
jgi:hypothetical protein